MQEDKLAIYESIGWIIASMPMEVAAETLRKFAVDIFGNIQSVQGQSSTENQMIIGMCYMTESSILTSCIYRGF